MNVINDSLQNTGIVMGTAGHIDHGKTALVRALTGVDLDRLEEEKRRGITIELGFVSLDLGEGFKIGIVDVPGHERFIKTMVAGAQGLDMVMLVIAADEGVKPQTTEHLDICKLLMVNHGLVALTKSDKVDLETIEFAIEEVKELTAGTFLEGAPIIPCSAITGDGIESLKKTILEIARKAVPRSAMGIFRMPVDRSFSVKGFGTVVTGTVISGTVSKGDEVEILPGKKRATVRDLEVHGEKLEKAGAGKRLAMNLSGIERTDAARGQWAAASGIIELTRTIDVWASVLTTHKTPLEHAHEIGLHTGTAFVLCEIDLLGEDRILPGGSAPARLHLKEALPLLAGDRFVLRSYARKATVAGGEIIDPHPKYRMLHRGRKGKKTGAAFLEIMAGSNVADRIEGLVDSAALQGVSRRTLFLRAPASPGEINLIIEKMILDGKLQKAAGKAELLIGRKNIASLREEMAAALDKYHKSHPLEIGPGKTALRGIVKKRAPDEIYELAADMLAGSGRAAIEGDKIRLSSHKPQAAGANKKAVDKVLLLLEQTGRTPPTISEMEEKTGIAKKELASLLRHLSDAGSVRKISESLYFSSSEIDKIKNEIERYFENNKDLDPVAFKNLAGVSRKFAIPLLEYFDREKFTMRVGNNRVLRKG